MGSESYPLPSFLMQPSGRVSTRVAAIFPVWLGMPESDGPDILARSVDIGMGGVCVRTDDDVDVDKVEFVRFGLGRHDLDFKVQVRWRSDPRSDDGTLTGFSFDRVGVGAEKALWNYIHERAHELASFLRSCGGLTHLDFQEAIELALTTRIREVESGEVVYGGIGRKPSTSIFALFRGSLVLERANQSQSQMVDVVRPCEFFGGIPMIAGCSAFERAIATSPSTLLEFVAYNTHYLLSTKPPLAAALVRAASFHWMQRMSRVLDRLYDDGTEA